MHLSDLPPGVESYMLPGNGPDVRKKPKSPKCNSLNSCRGGSYCRKCSHAVYTGQGKDRTGHLWRWEFSPQFGPLFVGVRGEALERQPIRPNHRAWEPFEKWQKEHGL